ncbi:MAG: NUDIX hydrolase [Deltaproteobacteria bacterium]|nr:MAG: NUDIX hydrolase [Deltaproteobacteria bacterium]
MMREAVVVVVTKGNKVLLIQRAPSVRGAGYWAPVSGEVEPGESQVGAVAREAMEEVGLTVRPLRKVWENISSRGTFRLHWWLAEYIAGELVLNVREVSDARWLTADEICGLDSTFEGDREFYQKVLPFLEREKGRVLR